MNRHLLRRALRLPQAAIKRLVTGLLQLVLLANRPARLARSGFVLPTTVLLVLMVVLTATALTYRSFTRSDMAISQREQQVIANAATPALDRARAKIEFVFNDRTRLPSGLPTGEFLASMMLTQPFPGTVAAIPGDPFTLPGETRLDINGDNVLDNAWSFVSDNDRNGEEGETITYSILVQDEALNNPNINIQSPVNQAKANALVTRTGPLATTEATTGCANARAEKGWQVVSDGNSSALQKNFQVNVFVPNANNVNRTVESFEFQQSRIANRGNKWAAWFRYDMEIFAFPTFNINGAMHTDSSLMVRSNPGLFTSFMISSNQSCVYSKEASEITVGATSEDGTFQGQIVRGVIFNNQYGGDDTSFHTFRENSTAANPVNVRTLTAAGNTDGVFSGDSVNNGAPADVAVNPLVLYTQDRLQHTNRNTWTRVAAWDTTNRIRTEGRILNKRVPKPFVDDFSRADNRWGPKPRYSDTDTALDVTNPANGVSLGDNIGAIDQVTNPITGLDGYWERQAVNYGLRMVVGQRLELGNPIEWNFNPGAGLGGAVEANSDRLYPPNAAPTVGTKIRENEYRQKLALRDNLAAVQSMVVYHYDQPSGGSNPAACMALTAHPGTLQSIVDSRTFALINGSTTTTDVKTDFFNGVGTNGWEYQWPATWSNGSGGSVTYASAISPTLPLGKALRNLAYFAGDPAGGAPSFPAVQDSGANAVVHPYPYMSMWGDFSVLRRILGALDAGGYTSAEYDALSPADKATLHTATCSIGMLARNVQQVQEEFDNASDGLSGGFFTSNGQKVARLIDGTQNGGNGEITQIFYTATINGRPNPFYDLAKGSNMAQVHSRWAGGYTDANGNVIPRQDNENVVIDVVNSTEGNTVYLCGPGVDIVGTFQPVCDMGEFAASFSFEQWVAAFRLELGEADANSLVRALRIIATGFSSERDRAMGFADGNYPSTLFAGNGSIQYDPSTGYSNEVNLPGGARLAFKSGCNPDNLLGALGGGGGGASARDAIVLSVAICGDRLPIKYPSLYYLFPLLEHDHDGGAATVAINGYNDTQPVGEQYITDPDNYITRNTVNATVPYQVINPANPNDLSSIALVPAGLNLSTGWKFPPTTAAAALGTTTANSPNNSAQAFTINVVSAGVTAGRNTAFLDKGMVDGREQMAIRVLDIDLRRLTNTTVVGGTDTWLSDIACNPDVRDCDVFTEGIIYAFREDAVREDEIVRPKTSAANSDACLTVATVISDACHMVTTPGSEKDPPLTAAGISLKPVDFYADPDRRPYGFRLRNGADMSRGRQRAVGMTFVTDNSTYIVGDFNLHSTNGDPAGTPGNLIEEFTAKIGGVDWDTTNFYTNRTEANVDARFAQPGQDTWRPVEILTDAFTILSAGFLDGAAEDTYIRARPGGPQAANTSYMNQSRPNAAQTVVRANGESASVASASPVFINRNGDSFRDSTTGGVTTRQAISTNVPEANWTGLVDSDPDRRRNIRSVPGNAFVNAVFIGGVVPNRIQQSNGGLHNFPRLIEDWDGDALQIAGAFFQLNFATTSTGPYEHDNWQPGVGAPDGNQRIGYYTAPDRRWGYDPGLLYYPPAAAARRFVSVDTPRSEYFRELPADDPYIANLRCAARVGADAGFVYADAGVRGICPPPA